VSEPIRLMPEGQLPLVSFRNRAGNRKPAQELVLPEVHILVGRDHISSGATVSVWEPTNGEYPRYRTLWAARWLEPILTTEWAMRHAANAAATAVAAFFGPEIPS